MSRIAEVLNRAADLIAPDGAWTQGTWARDASGKADPIPERATCWCLYGAIRVASAFNDKLSDRVTEAVRSVVGGRFISWNDAPGRTQAEVVAALRKAALQVAA